MRNVLIDAGPVIALFDRNDQHHERVMQFLQNYQGRLISTWPVMTEVSYMLDFNIHTQLDFFDWVSEGGIELYNLEQWQLVKIRALLHKYADLPADFADTTLIEAAEALNIDLIITIDKDFEIYRLKNGKALQNLLAE